MNGLGLAIFTISFFLLGMATLVLVIEFLNILSPSHSRPQQHRNYDEFLHASTYSFPGIGSTAFQVTSSFLHISQYS